MLSASQSPFKKQTMIYSCHYCNKKYKTKTNLTKHNLLCELIHNTSLKKTKPTLLMNTANSTKSNKRKGSREKEEDEEEEDACDDDEGKAKEKEMMYSYNNDDDEVVLPTPRQMYDIVCELSTKYTKLQDKLNKLSCFLQEKKKKVNILVWLNNNLTPVSKHFTKEFFQSIVIENTEIQCITSQGGKFFDMLYLIFARVFYQGDNRVQGVNDNRVQGGDNPIFALTQKPNTLYVYNQEQQWHELTNEKLIYMLNIVHFNCVKALSAWNKRNIETKSRKENEMLADQYSKALIELMSVNFKKELTLNKIKSNIYDNIKKDMKALLQVELEF